MDEIRPDPGDDVVDHLPLEHQSQLEVFVRLVTVDRVSIIKNPILCQMDPFLRQFRQVGSQFATDEAGDIHVEQPAIMRQSHVHVRPDVVERCHKRCGHIRQPTGFGGQSVR